MHHSSDACLLLVFSGNVPKELYLSIRPRTATEGGTRVDKVRYAAPRARCAGKSPGHDDFLKHPAVICTIISATTTELETGYVP